MKTSAASGPSRSPIVHLDVKTLGRMSPGDDHKMRGARNGTPRQRTRVAAWANYRNTQ